MSEPGYLFTNNWFGSGAKAIWDNLIPRVSPSRVLEIGAFEGASTCYLIEKVAALRPLEIHCVDTWQGGIEHQPGGVAQTDMSSVEQRFQHNTAKAIQGAAHSVKLVTHKGLSDVELARLLSEGKQGYFDFIYVDGSHQAPDVLCDALLSFRLLRLNGVIAFDDYLWNEDLPYGTDPIRSPKIAIDAFTNIYCRKIKILHAPLMQLYVQKTSD